MFYFSNETEWCPNNAGPDFINPEQDYTRGSVFSLSRANAGPWSKIN
jgi:hypothetical protein